MEYYSVSIYFNIKNAVQHCASSYLQLNFTVASHFHETFSHKDLDSSYKSPI